MITTKWRKDAKERQNDHTYFHFIIQTFLFACFLVCLLALIPKSFPVVYTMNYLLTDSYSLS